MPKWNISEPTFEADQLCPMYRVWPWNGHRRFAYDLVCFVRPNRIVELGTYWGNSFFSFCQAVKDHGLGTECIAVDTWEGDTHTGSYETDVFETVKKVVSQYFKHTNIRLSKMYFAEANKSVADRSVDILHIDGLHTYEAVKNDFETWLPKLTDRGIVLFHDIADDCGYGSVTFWKEIAALYPSFSFQHSWGLGVLFPKDPTVFEQIKKNNLADKLKIYEYVSRLALSEIQVSDLETFNAQQDHLIRQLEEKVDKISSEKKRIETMIARMERSWTGKALKRLGLLAMD